MFIFSSCFLQRFMSFLMYPLYQGITTIFYFLHLYDYLVIRKRFLLYTVYIILPLSLILTLYCGLQGYFLFVQYCRFTHFPYLFRHRKSSFWHALHLGSDSNLQAWHDVCWHGLWQLRDTSATLLQSKESIYILFIYMYTSQWHEDRYSG